MTTDRQKDIWRVEGQVKVWEAYKKWLVDKMGPRAQSITASPKEATTESPPTNVIPGGRHA